MVFDDVEVLESSGARAVFEEKKKKYVSKRNFQTARLIWLKASSIERGDQGDEFCIDGLFLGV